MVIGKRLNALVSAALIAVFGFIGVHEGLSFNIGSVSRMGPGFFPMALGVILVVVSAVILVQGFLQGSKLNETLQLNLEVKGWLLVLAGICSFILLGEVVGFVPAIFALVFLSALGVWLAENLGTLTGTWRYDGQAQGEMVSLATLGSWLLFLCVALMVALLVMPQATTRESLDQPDT